MTDCAQQVEERIDPRTNARIAIFIGPEHRKPMTQYSVNASTGGMFIGTDNIQPVDTLFVLKFQFPNNDAIITCKARVAWVNEPGNLRKSSLPPGMGLQFIDLSLENMHAIRDYLNKGHLVPIW
jgi:uncharacterized protein (TIGR02266 family)